MDRDRIAYVCVLSALALISALFIATALGLPQAACVALTGTNC